MDIRQIVEKLIQKDEKAWQWFLKVHTKLLTGIYRYFDFSGSHFSSSDFVQSFIEKLLEDDSAILKKFYGETELEFRAFIMKVARNYAKNLIRTKGHSIQFAEIKTDILFSDLPTPEKEVEFSFVHKELLSVMEKINPKYQKVLRLRFMENYRIKEIAKILQIPEKTVSTHIHRGIHELQYYLKEYGKNQISEKKK